MWYFDVQVVPTAHALKKESNIAVFLYNAKTVCLGKGCRRTVLLFDGGFGNGML